MAPDTLFSEWSDFLDSFIGSGGIVHDIGVCVYACINLRSDLDPKLWSTKDRATDLHIRLPRSAGGVDIIQR